MVRGREELNLSAQYNAILLTLDIYLLSAIATFLYPTLQSIVHIVICAMWRHNSVLKCMKVFGGSKLIQRARRVVRWLQLASSSDNSSRIYAAYAENLPRREERIIVYWNTTDPSRVNERLSPSCSHCSTVPRRALSSR